MAKKQKEPECPKGAPGWMTTFGDLNSLLLTFFVLLFTFSTLDVVKFREAVISLQGAIGVLSGGPQVLNLGDIPMPKSSEEIAGIMTVAELKQIETEVTQNLRKAVEKEKANVGETELEIRITNRGLLISISGSVLFDEGSADLKPTCYPLLNTIAKVFSKNDRFISVEGHADDVPISTERFPSNWELSAARACSVARYLIKKGISPKRLIVSGYAEQWPIYPNDTPEHRAKNRRVNIILLKDKPLSIKEIEQLKEVILEKERY